MYGITDNDPFDVMDVVRLVPRLLALNASSFGAFEEREAFPLNAKVRAVQKRVSVITQLRGLSKNYVLIERSGSPMSLDEPLMLALARNKNELYISEEPEESAYRSMNMLSWPDTHLEQSSSSQGGAEDSNESVDTAFRMDVERLHPSVLDGVPLDLHRELRKCLTTYFPHISFELRDMWGKELSELHTNRYYITSPSYQTREDPFFMLVPKTVTGLEIDIAPGIKLALNPPHYRFGEHDNKLVLSSQVFDALEKFSGQSDIITTEMLDTVLQTMPSVRRREGAGLRGQQLVDFLANEFNNLQKGLKMLLAHLSRQSSAHVGPDGSAAWPQRVDVVRQANVSMPARIFRSGRAGIHRLLVRLDVLKVALVKVALWLYRNNISSILFYTASATILSHLSRSTSRVIPLLWLYTFLVLFAAFLHMRTSINMVQKLVLFAYPQVYPIGETPADVLPAVPEARVRAAVACISQDQPVDYDGIVQSMVIKPSWLRVAAVCLGSLDPVSYKEWTRQVRQRRSLAYDAARLAVTKQQQIGL